MVLYEWIKLTHILSATLLFGTGLATTFFMVLAARTKDTKLIQSATHYVILSDFIFTIPSGVIQLLTGVWMVYLSQLSFRVFWIELSLSVFIFATLLWFTMLYSIRK